MSGLPDEAVEAQEDRMATSKRATLKIGQRVRLEHAKPFEGEVTFIGERGTVIVTRELKPGSIAHWRANPHTPLVGHPWMDSIEVPADWLEVA
jgi:hypothetical protein